MKLTKLELKNYKSHKHFVANFNGNGLISGNKGSGKTSLKDAFYWLMTTKLVDEPRPVDENGVDIDHVAIEVACEFEDGLKLRIEDNKTFKKDGSVGSRHSSTYFINETPVQEKEYLDYLEKNIGTLEQRRILLDPTWFAYGDGLRTTGKTSKTATQRRREIVISIAGAEGLEEEIAKNEDNAKAAKYAIGKLKKELDEAYAGIESLEDAKVDVSHLDKSALKQTLKEKNEEKTSTIKSLESLSSGNDTHNALVRALSDAQTEFSKKQAEYSSQYQSRLEQAEKPIREYRAKKQELQDKLQQILFSNNQIINQQNEYVREIERLERERQALLESHASHSASVFTPDTTTCQSCGQALPVGRLREMEARFNKHKSDELERITHLGKQIAEDLKDTKLKLENLPKVVDVSDLQKEIESLVEPQIEYIPSFNETPMYQELQEKIANAQKAIEDNSDDDVKAMYQRTINSIDNEIEEIRELLNKFTINDHQDEAIERKSLELQDISARLDEQESILEECNEFTRRTLDALEKTIEEKFDGIRFKMFEYTLDGTQKDTCITYAKTPNGFIPWESLSGGQKRSATISLANAFSKAWGVSLPLWIDDTQIYQEDGMNAEMQLIRITEVPNQALEVR